MASLSKTLTVLLMLTFMLLWAWEVRKSEMNKRAERLCWETLDSCKDTLHSCDGLINELQWRIQ